MGFFAPIFAAAAKAAVPSLVAGLFGGGGGGGGGTGMNLVKLRRDAEKAGFNPLAVLRSGYAGTYQRSFAPALASQATIGRALASGLDAALNYDPNAEQRNELEMALMAAQLENIQARTHKLRTPGDVGTEPIELGQVAEPEARQPGVTNPFHHWAVDPTSRDAEDWEARYGDWVGGIIGGVTVAAQDAATILPQVFKNSQIRIKARERAMKEKGKPPSAAFRGFGNMFDLLDWANKPADWAM